MYLLFSNLLGLIPLSLPLLSLSVHHLQTSSGVANSPCFSFVFDLSFLSSNYLIHKVASLKDIFTNSILTATHKPNFFSKGFQLLTNSEKLRCLSIPFVSLFKIASCSLILSPLASQQLFSLVIQR